MSRRVIWWRLTTIFLDMQFRDTQNSTVNYKKSVKKAKNEKKN